MSKKDTQEIVKSSGNIYKDLGFKDPDIMLFKANLAIEIGDIIKSRKLTQKAAAEIMEIDQPKVSKLIRGIISEFSIERLFGLILRLNADISVSVKPKKNLPSPKPKTASRIRRLKKGRLSIVNSTQQSKSAIAARKR